MQAATKPYRLDPCPVEERVSEYDDAPDEYRAFTHQATDREGSDEGSTGIQFQKCGGGRRVIRKKIGGG